jgi:sugar O-acyltransferase (sialic acid O-acetyltransferase NeuD family)
VRRVVIFGAGGCGRDLHFVLSRLIGSQAGPPPEIAFLDDTAQGPTILGRALIREMVSGDQYIMGIADGQLRQTLDERARAMGGEAFDLRAPTALIGDDVVLGEGAAISDFALLTTNIRVGRQFQANYYSHVSHDCVIGDYVTLAPKAAVNGNVQIGDGAYIGTGAVIKQGTADKPLVIGAGAVIGMGAVVTRDVAPGEVVMGNPARPRQ